MRFLLLGHFEIQRPDGSRLALTRIKHRQLLALLLLDSPHTVPTERCIAVLWGDGAPPSARRNLQTYIADLRKGLACSGVEIRTEPGGYRMTDVEGRLDLAEFEAARSAAATALAERDDAAAARLLRDGLALWRGGALQDLADSSDALRNAATQLDERRTAAVGDFAGACIRLGAYEEAIDQLRVAVARAPLREDLRARLMLALHKSGRRADALLVYHDCRAALVEHIGVGPSTTLTALHDRILLEDAGL
ncbi:AfsR/SARP family transcriptional regulator [Herbidospora yilanensis]|uniref:AfsR/SARP family transcriptional regulator n=1 Tax=Herbidospora yilanensis TaxID=354426 RepID=UPI0007823C44|nr:BTAD domain-containing putative transcriptional regulator [Herbidospora yilanensis]